MFSQLKNMSMGKKYTLVFSLCMSLVLISAISLWVMLEKSKSFTQNLISYSDIALDISDLNATFKTKFGRVSDYFSHPTSQAIEDFEKQDQELEILYENLEKSNRNEKIASILLDMKNTDKTITSIFKNDIIPLIDSNDSYAAELRLITATRLRTNYEILYDEVKSIIQEEQQVTQERTIESIMTTIYYLIISLVLSLSIGFILMRTINRQVQNAVNKIMDYSNNIASGNINVPNLILDEKNELGNLAEATNLIRINLKDTIDKLNSEVEYEKELIHELEAKNAELERFTYTVSHDLKSPLITIQGFIGIILSDIDDGNVDFIKQDLDKITKAANKMQALLEDLLELSRIGRIINPPTKFSMNSAAEEAIELLEASILAKNANVILKKPMPQVNMDRKRIIEVFQNLIENALKYSSPDLDPIIEIGFFKNEAGENIYFVKDNGIGIDLQYSDKIFNLFEKLDNKTEGTGIGLAIVKRIIELYNGTIWFESKGENLGTTFFFKF